QSTHGSGSTAYVALRRSAADSFRLALLPVRFAGYLLPSRPTTSSGEELSHDARQVRFGYPTTFVFVQLFSSRNVSGWRLGAPLGAPPLVPMLARCNHSPAHYRKLSG